MCSDSVTVGNWSLVPVRMPCSGLRGRFVGEWVCEGGLSESALLRESSCQGAAAERESAVLNLFGVSNAPEFEGDGHTRNTPAGVVD